MEKVMIIDSDIRQMRELNDGLSPSYQILNCSRGSKAMELFQVYQPSALVLDPATPEMNGRAFVRQIRSLPVGAHMPILALTKITTLRHIEDSFDWGVNMIFSKPCSGERVKKKLDELFAKVSGSFELASLEA
jgi:response regulator RpfG family c-di-GMP phosphodiesterase